METIPPIENLFVKQVNEQTNTQILVQMLSIIPIANKWTNEMGGFWINRSTLNG